MSSQDEINECDQVMKNITKGVSNKNNNDNNINNNVRVKVLLTKAEAAKLLAKCKGDEGGLDFKDVVNQLMKLPPQRINVVSSPSKDFDLETISEEEEEEEEYDEYQKKNV